MPAGRLLFTVGAVLAALVVAIQPVGVGSIAPAQGNVTRELIASGLEWPVSFAFAPDGRIFFNERFTGRIRVIANGTISPFDVGSVPVLTAGEQGLLGLALDPQFATSPWVYVYHTHLDAGLGRAANRVVRIFAAPGGPPSEVIVDRIPAGTFHNGGILGFAPDGTLYITTGDAQAASNSQDPAVLAGKILRVERDGAIPVDNPIAGSPVFSLGHRNVFGLAFHPATDVAYVSENGPNQNDEINVIEPGGNYGWPDVTGDANDARYLNPILTFASVIAPTGVAFVTGAANASWRDNLFLGDWNRGALQRISLAPPDFRQVLSTDLVENFGAGGILDVEAGPDGSIYVSTPDAIYRINATGEPANGVSPTVDWLAVLAVASILVVAVAVLVAVLSLGIGRKHRGGPPRGLP